MQKTLTSTIALVLILTLGGTAAFAQAALPIPHSEATAEAAALDGVTVSLTDAIASVEAMKTGKVAEAVLMTEGAVAVYQITTLMPDGTETNYAVDAKTGAIVATVDAHQDDNDRSYEGQNEHNDKGQTEGPQGDGDGETQDDVAK